MTAAVVAAADNDVIGRDGDLPWHLPADLRWFQELTMGHVVVAGRVTHEAILRRLGRPLPDRITVVVSRGAPQRARTVVHATSPDVALDMALGLAEWAGRQVYVIGGAAIYAATADRIDLVHLTRVHVAAEGDASLPPGWLDGFRLAAAERHVDEPLSFTRERWERVG